VRDIGQVFLDVACSACLSFASRLISTYPPLVHRWPYDHPGILHCYLSFNDITRRFIEEMNAKGEPERKVRGALAIYDLSSWKDLGTDYWRKNTTAT